MKPVNNILKPKISNSYICRLIYKDPNWRQVLKDKQITVKQEGNLIICNYRQGANFSDEIVREARGIIINIDTCRVVCFPMNKFGNWNEYYADTIDWIMGNFTVYDKIDGSLVKLWYNEAIGEWQWSTNGCITTDNIAYQNEYVSYTWNDLIHMAQNYNQLNFDKLQKYVTYMFELISPYTQIVVKYPITRLYYLAARQNISGEEIRQDNIGISRPSTHRYTSLEHCVSHAERLNTKDHITDEGYVIVDKEFHRIKVKSPSYIAYHYLRTGTNFSKRKMIKLIQDPNVNQGALNEKSTEFTMYWNYYQFRVSELEYHVERYITYVRALYEELSHDRKAVYEQIHKDKYGCAGLSAIGNERTAKEILNQIYAYQTKKYLSWIKEFPKK